MIIKFVNDDEGYLAWVEAHHDGYVVNADEPQRWAPYPMVHRATHKAISTSMHGNYTTKRYYKVCSRDVRGLENWAKAKFKKELTTCRVCM